MIYDRHRGHFRTLIHSWTRQDCDRLITACENPINVRYQGYSGEHLLQVTLSHVAVLVTVFDFSGDPAAAFVRMRMEPPFG